MLTALSPGVPVDVKPGGDLHAELSYGNHRSAGSHCDAIYEELVYDVIHGRALVFDRCFAREIAGLRVAPLGVVEEPKFRIIHDLSSSQSSKSTSVNEDTDFSCAPPCELGHVIWDVLLRVMYLRQKFGPNARIVLSKLDVKSAFRQVPVDRSRAPIFGYVVEDLVVVDLRLQFGWTSSPGFWGIFSSALEHSHTHTTFEDALVSEHGRGAAESVHIADARNRVVAPLPSDCADLGEWGGRFYDPFFVRYYVDDGILVEVQWWPDGRRCLRATRSLVSDHFRLFGERGANEPPLLSEKKMSDWDTCLEVLGYVIDSECMTVSLSPQKISKLRRVLSEWPVGRTSATAKQISSLTGFLLHVAFVIRPGKFFVGRMLSCAGVKADRDGDFSVKGPNRARVIPLSPEFHADLEFWRWLSSAGLDVRGGSLMAPMYDLVYRPPARTIFTDASKTAVGGYCAETGMWFLYDLTGDERRRFDSGEFSINVLELLGMVLGAYVLVVLREERPIVLSDRVLLQGDNNSAVHWIQRCRGGAEPRSGALMRLLGVLEVAGGWCFDAEHVPGVLNNIADGISRWEVTSVQSHLVALCPNVSWQEYDLGDKGKGLCSCILASGSSDMPLRGRLSGLIWDILGLGFSCAR